MPEAVKDEFADFPDAPAQSGVDEFADFPDAPVQVSQAAPIEKPPSLLSKYLKSGAHIGGPMEIATNLAGNVVGAPIAGLAGLGAAATNALGITNTPAADVVESVSGAFNYEPRTTVGKAGAAAISYPFQKLQQGAQWVGNKVNNPGVFVPTQYGLMQGGPALATALDTGIQGAPALAGLRGRGSAAPLTEAQTAAESTARAKDYVARNTSLDWDSLSASVKERLTQVARESGNLDLLDPRSIERQATLESLPTPVKGTRGQITRDPVQLRNEGNVSATEAGKPIRDVYVSQTQALLKNLDILKGKVSGRGAKAATAETPEQVGQAVQDAALRKKAEVSKNRYNLLYKKARATEPTAEVSADSFYNLLEKNPEVQRLGFMESWLKRGKVESDGGRRNLKLAELQDLRETAGGIARTGGTDGYYAGKVVAAVDDAMAEVPAAAKAWKDAQQAFKQHKMEFEEQGAVAKLVEDKSRTDRATALEATWQQVVKGGSIEDLQKVKRSLLTGGTKETQAAGIKAWRDIRAQTIQHIINEATKSVTRYEDGTPNLTPAAMERAIKSIGEPKLREIFGDTTVNQLNKVMEATRIVKTEPPTGFKGSPTLANTIALLEKSIGKVPFLGDTITGTVKTVGNLKDLGAVSREMKKSQDLPLDSAARNALTAEEKQAFQNRLYQGLVRGAPASASTQGRNK